MKKNKKLFGLAAAAGIMLVLSGCSGQSVTYDPNAAQNTAVSSQTTSVAQTVTATPTPTVTVAAATPTPTPTPIVAPTITPIAPIEITPTVNPDAGLKLLGEKAEGDNIYKTRVKNSTGFSVVWFSVKDNFTDYFPSNVLQEKDSIANNETRVLYYDATHGFQESAEREEKAVYLIRFALKSEEEMKDEDAEGHYYIIHNIPFSDLEEAELCFNATTAVPYIRYKSKASGTEVSTEAEETALYEESRGDSDEDEEGSSERSSEGSSENNASQEQETAGEGSSQDGETTQETDQNENYNEEVPDEIIEFEDDTVEITEQTDDGGDDYIDYDANDDEIIYYDENDEIEEAVG